MTASAWTQDRIDRLRILWRDGKTADQIARDLGQGISRSAVLGKVHRMGLSQGRVPRAAPPIKVDPPPVRAARAPVQKAPLPEPGLATVLSVRRRQCRWPYGEPGAADFSLCGRPVARGAFCASHAAVAYRTPPETGHSLERLARIL